MSSDDQAMFALSREELDALPIGVITLDRRGIVLRYNRTEATYARRSADAVLGKNLFTEIVPGVKMQPFYDRFMAFAAKGESGYDRFDFTFLFSWGHRDVEILFCRRRGVEPIDIIVTTRNRPILVSDTLASDEATRVVGRWQQPKTGVRTIARDAHWRDDLLARTTVWSPEMFDLCELGYDRDPPLGGSRPFSTADDAAHVEMLASGALEACDGYACEHGIITACGNERFVEVHATVTCDAAGVPTAIEGRATDVTARRREERDLWYSANFDGLTGLANRHYFERRLQDAVATGAIVPPTVTIVFINVDRFKIVNDTYGHVIGDEVLREIAERLRRCTHRNDLIARLGSDEFVVLIEGLIEDDDLEMVFTRILAVFATPIAIHDRSISLSASVGVSASPAHGENIETLMRAAEAAMHESKRSRRHDIVRYTVAMQREQSDGATLESELARALDEGQLELYYQPIVDRTTHEMVCAEGLLRWNHPKRGIVRPDDFIHIAERNGAIIPIGTWVIGEACRAIRRAIDAGGRPMPIAVNVSLVQLWTNDLANVVRAALAVSPIDPALLTLELTESVASGDFFETMRALVELKNLGIRLAMDDFGTGYSSLAHLKYFPIDSIKLDRAFVADIASSPLDRAIARTVVSLAQTLHLDVVAEGVETLEQARCMEEVGCQRLQGYLFGRPVPAAHLFAFNRAASC